MKYIVAIDQSTSATKGFVFDEKAQIVERMSLPHRQFYPKAGWVEQDAEEIFQNTKRIICKLIHGRSVSALAFSNQRETVILWDRETGKPLANAIGWQDSRAEEICNRWEESKEPVHQTTGLLLSPYYSAAKASHALYMHPEWKNDRLCIGTMDSYIIFRLTEGKKFVTDVTNASRTQLMNLQSLEWDEEICRLFGIKKDWLPQILPSDGQFGYFEGLPIHAVMGDSHAALFGHGCCNAGDAKATFGTGSSVMMNVGTKPLLSSHGLSACVGYCFNGSVSYVLEGNVSCSGDTLCWLRDQVQLLENVEQIESLAASSADGVYLVPAFVGLGAPHFRTNARGILCGMNRGTTRAHILRAAMESIAYQDVDVLAAMKEDTGILPNKLHTDGGPSRNATLMQFLSDLIPCPVQSAVQSEISAWGAAKMAGISEGLYAPDEIADESATLYMPQMAETLRKSLLTGWRTAVEKA